MKPIDYRELHGLEEKAREIGRLIGGSIDSMEPQKKRGFCLMLFSFDGAEMTWICNANRDDMLELLDEFKTALMRGKADTLSQPKGKG